jgi:hypothetical protein
MAYRIVGHRIETQRSPSPEVLRRKFESSVCELHRADMSARRRAPIVPRRMVLGISQADAERLAVSDAARALAQLWNV